MGEDALTSHANRMRSRAKDIAELTALVDDLGNPASFFRAKLLMVWLLVEIELTENLVL